MSLYSWRLSWTHYRKLRHDRPSGRFSKSRGLSASVSFLSSPPPPRSFTCAIFARSLTLVPRFLLLNRTEMPATQAMSKSPCRNIGTIRRVRWVAFTKTYSQGKLLISHLPPTFAILYLLELFNFLCPRCGAYSRAALIRVNTVIIYIPRVPVPPPRVPYLMSPSPSSRVAKSQVPTRASQCLRPTFIHSLLRRFSVKTCCKFMT